MKSYWVDVWATFKKNLKNGDNPVENEKKMKKLIDNRKGMA